MKNKPRILVVEDDQSWQSVYSELVIALGYAVIVVGTKIDALREVDNGGFDAFLIDIRLENSDQQNKDGLSILQRLFESREADRAIMNTGFMTRDFQKEIERLGPFDVLEKTDEYPLNRLVESLHKVVARSYRTHVRSNISCDT